jgi:opacity protein-like surface antigen
MAITPVSSRQRVGKSVLAGVALGVCLLWGGDILAGDNWAFEPSITQNVSWETNPLMLPGSHSTLFGSTTIPQLKISDNSPTTQINALASVNENIFNESDFNSTDLHANISIDKKLQQWEAGFIEASDYDTTRTSEISTLNINTVGSIRHFGNTFTPTISFSPTSVEKISLSGSYAVSRYDSNLFTDYHILSVTPSFQYNYNPRNTAIISFQAQRFETDTAMDATVDSIAPTLGWTATLTPAWTAKATAGYEGYRQRGDAIPSQQWKWKPVFSADLTYTGPLDTFSFDASRALQPYGNGTEFFLNTISLAENHAITPLFSANVNGSYEFAGNSNQAATNLRSLITANAGLSYHATPKLDITSSYQYRDQTLTNVSGNQNDNLFIIGLVYRPILPIIGSNK